jgi:hypothetical protein
MTLSMLEFVDRLKEILETEEEFNFSILTEMNPIIKKYTFVCKVLAIIVKVNNKNRYIHYDEVTKQELNYAEIRDNHTRKVGKRSTPFFIDGSSKIQTFKDNDFIEYSLRSASRTDLKFVDKIREKFNVQAHKEFVGMKLGFEEDIDF